MATTLPYAAPYARTTARAGTQARQAPRVDASIIRYALVCTTSIVLIALAQLYLTGEATDTMNRLTALEKENSLIQAQIDEQQAQIERLRSPRRIEEDATRLGLQPFKSVYYAHP